MFGFLIGTACLIGLIKVLRGGRGWHRRGWGHHGYGYGGGCGESHGGGDACGYGGGGDCGPGYGRGGDGPPWSRGEGGGWGPPWARGGFGSGFFLRGLFSRIEATPTQQKAIVDALDELRATAKSHREEFKKSRDDVARVMRSASVDETLLGEAFARQDQAIEAMRKAFVGALAKVHEVLDEKQREALADLIESGPRGFRRGWGGPFRTAAWA